MGSCLGSARERYWQWHLSPFPDQDFFALAPFPWVSAPHDSPNCPSGLRGCRRSMTGATGEDTSASPTWRGRGARAMSVFVLFPLVMPRGGGNVLALRLDTRASHPSPRPFISSAGARRLPGPVSTGWMRSTSVLDSTTCLVFHFCRWAMRKILSSRNRAPSGPATVCFACFAPWKGV